MLDERELDVHEERFVVEVSEPVSSAEVAAVADRIALHLHMDAARVLKLLDGRTGPVTKPVLREKANIIAATFEDAGVVVVVQPSSAALQQDAGGVVGSTPDAGKPGIGDADPWPAEDAKRAGDGGAVAGADDGPAAADRVPAEPAARGASVDADPGESSERPRGGYVGRTGVQPRVNSGDPGRRGGGGSNAAADSGQGATFLSSTRWVPSPHEDLGFSPDDIGGDHEGGLPDDPLPTRRTYSAETDWAKQRARPRDDGPGLRSFLLVGLVVALVLLLVLQAINRNRESRVPVGATVAMGLDAYRSGDFDKAARIWRPLAEADDPTAQYMLGYMAENGLGQPWSNHEASVWYQRAADLGQPQAQSELGMLYFRGMGVERDPARAAALLRAAATSGYGVAQYEYAMLLFQGEGVTRDFAEALHWFTLAEKNGVAEARAYVDSLASWSGSGSSVSTDP